VARSAAIAGSADIARHRRDRKGKSLTTDSHWWHWSDRGIGKSGHRVIGSSERQNPYDRWTRIARIRSGWSSKWKKAGA